eukprot:Gb_13406 [translate_table: standard]
MAMEYSPTDSSVDILAFPLPAQGHIIPFMQLCELLAAKNLNVIFLTTPLTAQRLRSQADAAGVGLMEVPVPRVSGLPEGVESTDRLPPRFAQIFFHAIEEMESSVRHILTDLRPKCLVADFTPLFLPVVAAQLRIPVFYMPTMGAYSLSLVHSLVHSLPLPSHVESGLVLQGLPRRFWLRDCDILPPYRDAGKTSFISALLVKVFGGMRQCSGLVMNTFDALEAEFVDHIRKIFGKSVWTVGPVLRPQNQSLMSQSDSNWECVRWLHSHKPGSVLYITFGSEIALSRNQMEELALGLEGSGQPFLWAVKKPRDQEENPDFPLGFEKRTRGRGVVVIGRAPQQAILCHPSTGGFLSHCGWNSTLESICQGLPMLTWPFQHDQPFVNKLLVEELQVAEELKRDHCMDGTFLVKREEVERAVRLVMEEDQGKEMKRRALELKAAARTSTEKDGSSFLNLNNLAEVMRNMRSM